MQHICLDWHWKTGLKAGKAFMLGFVRQGIVESV